jgi:hypothetical protein
MGIYIRPQAQKQWGPATPGYTRRAPKPKLILGKKRGKCLLCKGDKKLALLQLEFLEADIKRAIRERDWDEVSVLKKKEADVEKRLWG